MGGMETRPDLLTLLLARRDELIAQQHALVTAGNWFAADDLDAAVRFSIRQANDALMGRCS